ncbi:hypothetical protein EIP86_007611 [Pleurotus ostreatoroseus]|nr:hypothetical protein EIP86_007611 [Pleurotus ostreatoroseus]
MQSPTTVATRARLPTEILNAIIRLIPRDALPAILSAHSVVYAIGCKKLYQRRDLGESLSPPKTILLLKTLSKSDADRPSYLPHPKSFLRFLTVDFKYCHITSNLLRLITRALLSVPHLQKLALYLPQIAKLDVHFPYHGWVLDDLTEPICHEFQTNLYCDAELKRFLESQHDIRVLTLFWDDDFYPDEEFELNSHALPFLQAVMLRTDCGWPHDTLLRTIVEGRPVVAANCDLVARGDGFEPLRTLATSGSCPLRALTFDMWSSRQIVEVGLTCAALLPELNGLHLTCKEIAFQPVNFSRT